MKMKRSLIAIAAAGLAGAVVTPAMADATAYGLVQVEVSSYSNQQEASGCGDQDTASGEGGCDGIALQDRANGRVGLKASEDLGNGWTGLAKAEFSIDTSDNGGVGGRDAMVGLKGSGVTIELGTLKSAYKYTGGVKYDPFVATTLESRRDNGGMFHTKYGQGGFLRKSAAVLGKAGPIKYWLTYALGEGTHDMTASVMYSQGPVEAFVALSDSGDYDLKGDDPTTPATENLGVDSTSATKIGGAFKTGPHKIKLQYEMVTIENDGANGGSGAKVEPTYTFLGYEMKMGKNVIVAQLGTYDSDDSGKDTDYMTIGMIHHFTKMTRLFAGYRSSDAEDDSDEDVISVGLRKNF